MTRLITTSLKSRPSDVLAAKNIAEEFSLDFVSRNDLSLVDFFSFFDCSNFYLVKNGQLSIINQTGEELFFHPGTGLIRTKMLEKKEPDLLITALGIKPEDSVLDCTGGLLNDSIVISYFLEKGNLTTLEKSRELFIITKKGLENYLRGSKKLKESFKKINLLNIDYNDLFDKIENKELLLKFHSIYFDPMFEKPVLLSSGISKVREYASYDILSQDTILRALKLADKRVVVKIRNNNYQFIREMNPNEILGGSRSRVRYAVFEK